MYLPNGFIRVEDGLTEDPDHPLDTYYQLFNTAKYWASASDFTRGRPSKEDPLKGRLASLLFFESSTRTCSSFEAAMKRLGGDVLKVTDTQNTSMAKGESFADTIRAYAAYSDAIVLRSATPHACEVAREVSTVPIINAGQDSSSHPTQALLDVYTMSRHFSTLKGKTLTMVGDLKKGRTIKSLARLSKAFGMNLQYVGAEDLYFDETDASELGGPRYDALTEDVLKGTDVLYMTRFQQERWLLGGHEDKLPPYPCLTPELADMLPENSIILHPLPRRKELPEAIDANPRAHYFDQLQNGLYVRMALLQAVMG